MYTFIKLTVPPPSMILFDASNRDQCEVKRLQTNTPLQALMMMNDPTVLEASRVLAQTLLQENGAPDEKLKTAFERIVCRTPTEKEMGILKSYYADQLQQFQQRKLDATATLNVGEYAQNEKLNKDQTAALMKVINTIYNLEEALIK
jgi:hypothetical protein